MSSCESVWDVGVCGMWECVGGERDSGGRGVGSGWVSD